MNWRMELVEAVSSAGHRPVVVALVGPPGSGKSTLAVAARTMLGPRCVVLSLDAARARLSPWADEADQDATPAAIGTLRTELRDALRDDRVVIVDATHARTKNRRQVLSLARERDATAIAVVTLPPIEFSLARNAHRSAHPGASGWVRRVPEDVVRTMHNTISDNLPRVPDEGWDLVLRADHAEQPHGGRRANTGPRGTRRRTPSRIRGIRGRLRRVPGKGWGKPRHASVGGTRR